VQTRLLSLAVIVCLSSPLAVLGNERGERAATPAATQHQAHTQLAQIVMVGSVQDSAELRLVIRELLQRDGVEPEFTLSARFTPEALLAEPDSDGRVRVFISLPSPSLAQLYLRGPFGHRFLLRELALREGLDELGRESIAQVVASSTQTLLHTRAGIDREAARAGLTREPAPEPAVAAEPPAATRSATPEPLPLQLEILARASGAWTGAALHERLGGGLELGVRELLRATLHLRQRLLFEQFAVQHLHTHGLEAEVRASALRLGLDVLRAWGPHSFGGGLLAGVDLLAIKPKKTSDPAWSLAEQGIDAVPMLRAELGYERQFGALALGCSVYADVALIDSYYEVREGSEVQRVAHPWRVAPGLALRLGWRSRSLR
jgi:hypothetical protein